VIQGNNLKEEEKFFLLRIYENFEINEVYKISIFLNLCLYDSYRKRINKKRDINKKEKIN